jgi:hypothetical protein
MSDLTRKLRQLRGEQFPEDRGECAMTGDSIESCWHCTARDCYEKQIASLESQLAAALEALEQIYACENCVKCSQLAGAEIGKEKRE